MRAWAQFVPVTLPAKFTTADSALTRRRVTKRAPISTSKP